MSDSSQTQAEAIAPKDQAQASASTEPVEPASEADTDAPSFGWNAYAERTNGRFAMVGFIALLLLELFTRQDFWTWIGL